MVRDTLAHPSPHPHFRNLAGGQVRGRTRSSRGAPARIPAPSRVHWQNLGAKKEEADGAMRSIRPYSFTTAPTPTDSPSQHIQHNPSLCGAAVKDTTFLSQKNRTITTAK